MLDQVLEIGKIFPHKTISEWEKVTKTVLKTDDLDKKLLFRSVEGFDIYPLHTETNWTCELSTFPKKVQITDSEILGTENIIDITEVHNAGGSIIQEVFYLAYQLVQKIELGLNYVEIHIACDSLYFSNIAKLRAVRYISEKIISESKKEIKFSIKAHNSLREQTLFDPWVNMLRSTASSMAAILGGADYVSSYSYDHLFTVYTGKKASGLGVRNAENELKILLEESHLDRVNDPMKGSHSIEHITLEIIKHSWEMLLKEKDEFDIKKFSSEVEDVSLKRYELARKRKITITGVNNFANPDESIFSLFKSNIDFNKHIGSSNFPLRTVAFEFEIIRDTFEVEKNPVKIFVCDDEAKVSARINFCKNYFEVIGARVSEIKDCTDIKQEDHIIICATDDTYNEKLEQIINTVISNKARSIHIAGKVDLTKYDQVTNCLYMGQNVFDVLSHFVKEVC